jgi:hypothetical protein
VRRVVSSARPATATDRLLDGSVDVRKSARPADAERPFRARSSRWFVLVFPMGKKHDLKVRDVACEQFHQSWAAELGEVASENRDIVVS